MRLQQYFLALLDLAMGLRRGLKAKNTFSREMVTTIDFSLT